MLNPRAGEEAELAEARAAMQKGARLGEDLQAVAALLDGADGGLSALRQAARRLDRIAGEHELLADALAALDRAEIGRAHAELQSLMRISYAVFCLKKKKQIYQSKNK